MNPDEYDAYIVDSSLVDESLRRELTDVGSRVIRIVDVVEVLRTSGIQVFVEGGAPRDWLRHAPAKDVDLAVDCDIHRVREALDAAFPAVDAVRIRLDDFGMLRWGSDRASVDINILRSPDDLVGGRLSETHFEPSGSLYADCRMVDFSVNAFYYDCAAGVVLAPYPDSLSDLRQMRLRLNLRHGQVQ